MKKLVAFSLFLAMVVIILGAYTRLTDAGLGCPDWPGCYGNLTVPTTEGKVLAANKAYPERPVEAAKAWNEMIHRYFAGALGLCILAIAILAVRNRHKGTPVKLPVLLLGLVIFQAALGMWTVTLNLLPVVVMGHLLGGFSVLACLFLLYLKLRRAPKPSPQSSTPAKPGSRLLFIAAVGIVVLVGQIALGGWTSANYAALACTEMPICEAGWQQRLDFPGAYSVPEAENYEYGAHDYDERMTMHIMHRVGALITCIYLVFVAIYCLRTRSLSPSVKRGAMVMLAVLSVQVALGISNVVLSLPLLVAVAHNGVAAALLLTLIWLTWSLFNAQQRVSHCSTHGGHYG